MDLGSANAEITMGQTMTLTETNILPVLLIVRRYASPLARRLPDISLTYYSVPAVVNFIMLMINATQIPYIFVGIH